MPGLEPKTIILVVCVMNPQKNTIEEEQADEGTAQIMLFFFPVVLLCSLP